MMTLFSIVMPTRDRPEMLADAIQSVLHQTLQDWELIVVDDSGTESATPPADPRIRVLRTRGGQGPAVARNLGLAATSGQFVAFLDDDDAWASRRLQHALEAHRHADLAICQSRLLGEGETDPLAGSGEVKRDPSAWILEATAPSTGQVSILRTKCPRFNPDYAAAEDLDWWIRATAEMEAAAMIPAMDWLWQRHHEVRVGIGADRRIEASRRLLEEHATYFSKHPKARAFRWRRIGIMSLSLGRHHDALAAALRSLAAHPTLGGARLLLRSLRSRLLA